MDRAAKSYKGYKVLILIAYLFMITLGLIETIKGAIIPSIRTEFLVEYTDIGEMLFISSLGYLVTTFFGGKAIEKYGLKKVFILGASIVIISAGLFSKVSSFYGIIGVYLLLGVGTGCFEGINTLAAKIFVKNKAMMMNLMHLFFGAGAIIAPKYAGKFIQSEYPWTSIYLPIMILMLGILVIILFTKFPEISTDQIGESLSYKKVIKSSKPWLFAMILGLFNIMEIGLANWLVNYLQIVRSLDVAASTTYLTGFFITFTFGRLIGGIIADKTDYVKTLFYFTGIAAIMILGGVMLGQKFIFLFSMAGFFISIIFPTMLVLVMREYTYGVSTVMGFVITMCGILTMIGNWTIGKVNDVWGVSAGMGSLGICGIIACILLLVLKKQVVPFGISEK